MVFQIRWTEDYTKGHYTLFDVEVWQKNTDETDKNINNKTKYKARLRNIYHS